MATGALRFRTAHVEELPSTQSRRAPGFAYVAVSGPAQDDPSKNWGTTNRKRASRAAGGQTEAQKEALSAQQQRQVERRIRDLNNDNSKDVQIPLPKGQSGGGGGAANRLGKTTQTKKILNSGKTFAHYLDDEEAEIARTGRRDGDAEATQASGSSQRPSKTPIARRKVRAESSVSSSPAPSAMQPHADPPPLPQMDAMDIDGEEREEDGEYAIPRLPTSAEMEALLNAPPLAFNQARSASPPPGAPPARQFCETCGYWGRVKCSKCGVMTCSVVCKATHDDFKCLKVYV